MTYQKWLLWGVAVFYSFSETAHFGWNGLPNSDAEIICDGIAALIFVVALKD